MEIAISRLDRFGQYPSRLYLPSPARRFRLIQFTPPVPAAGEALEPSQLLRHGQPHLFDDPAVQNSGNADRFWSGIYELHRLPLGLPRPPQIVAAQSCYLQLRKPAEPGITLNNRLFIQTPLVRQHSKEFPLNLAFL